MKRQLEQKNHYINNKEIIKSHISEDNNDGDNNISNTSIISGYVEAPSPVTNALDNFKRHLEFDQERKKALLSAEKYVKIFLLFYILVHFVIKVLHYERKMFRI